MSQAKIQSAVAFLQDPATAASPLNSKIHFLESKGLSNDEIQRALSLAANPQSAPYSPQYHPLPHEHQPDWRDWFVVTVVGTSIGMLCWKLGKKYLMPALAPPSQTDLEAATDALTSKYDEAAAILAELQEDTKLVKQDLENQASKVDETLHELDGVIQTVKTGEEHRDRTIKEIKAEVDSIRDLLPKMMEKNKDSSQMSLSEIQQELKSLKSLLLSRQPVSSTPPTSTGPAPTVSRYSLPPSGSTLTPPIPSKSPGIPAWQLAHSPSITADKPSSESTPETSDNEKPVESA